MTDFRISSVIGMRPYVFSAFLSGSLLLIDAVPVVIIGGSGGGDGGVGDGGNLKSLIVEVGGVGGGGLGTSFNGEDSVGINAEHIGVVAW